MSGDAEVQQAEAAAEQIVNDAMQYKKPNWFLITALVTVSIGAVALQIVGLVLEGKWTSTLYFWSVGFNAELWSKAGGLALAGLAAVLAVTKASVEVYATYSHVTNVNHEHHRHESHSHKHSHSHQHLRPQISGFDKVEAALGRLASADELRSMMMEHRDATKADRVEIDKDGLASLFKQGDVIKDLAAAGGLARISKLEAELAGALVEKQRALDDWAADRSELQALLDAAAESNHGLTAAKAELDRQIVAVTEAHTAAAKDVAVLKAELAAVNRVLGVGAEFMKDWSGVTAHAARFSDALSTLKTSAA